MMLRTLHTLALGSSLVALALATSACGGSTAAAAPPKGAVLSAGSVEGSSAAAIADDDTWLSLEAHGARMQVPAGWSYSRRGGELVAEPKDHKAAVVFTGAAARSELEAKVRAIGAEWKVEQVDFGKPRAAKIHGIDCELYEDMVAVSGGQPADVFVLVGDAPNGKGVVITFIMAWDSSQTDDPQLIDAANSLRPL